ncbi:histidine kinase dimerization/phosphoacceptor domain -containing protein [Emticicia sp. W12TSBA100-4]|uniref:tetratricopeptide repeat-containing sensor histidine kinase n=1 Tax=Emticicia sp. W12TSBA100-4 TaxID=3160965 RepID=UPI0033066121
MKKLIPFFIIALSSVISVFAQPAPLNKSTFDSLKNVINSSANDTAKVHAFYWISRATTLSNTSESISFASKGLALAQKAQFPIGEIECLEALCFSYAITSSFDIGFKSAYQQMELSRTHAPIREVFGINMMGLLYQKLGDDKAALKWARKSYFHPKMRVTDPFTQWSAMFLLSQEYERENKLDSAETLATETLNYSKKFFPMQEGYPKLVLARISSKLKNFNEAISYCKQIIEKSEEDRLDFFTNEVQNELAQIYFAQSKPDSAKIYAEKALDGAKQLRNYLVVMNSAGLLSQIFEKNNPIKAFDYLKLSMAAKDTVTNIEKNKQVKILEIKEKQRIEDLNLAAVYAKNELRFNTVIGLLFTALLTAFILYRNNRQKQKANTILQEQKEKINSQNITLETTLNQLTAKNAENELLLKEIHHRVKNNLEVVSSLLALQSAKIEDPEIQDAMLASQNRVQSMGILHQKLYQSEHLAFIEMKNYFQNLCENILDSYNETERIEVDIDMNEIELDVDTAVPVGLIVNELLTNSLKYAFPNGKKGTIKLSLENIDKDNLTLKISDNGIGKSLDTKAKGTGFGTQLVDLLTRQIGGKLTQEVQEGTIISINFKRQMAA